MVREVAWGNKISRIGDCPFVSLSECEEGEGILKGTITEDKLLVSHYQPESMRISLQ